MKTATQGLAGKFTGRTGMAVKAAQALTLGALVAFAQPIFAQDASRTTVRGTITEVSGDTLKVHTASGSDVSAILTPKTAVRGVALAKVSDIKPGSFVGTAAIPQPDGSQKALEIHVFPESMRGSGEGFRPWDLERNSTMTNGTVGSVVTGSGRTLTVKYQNGEKRIVVPDDVPIVSLEPGTRDLLKPGVHVMMFTQKGSDGKVNALAVSAGENGITPPM